MHLFFKGKHRLRDLMESWSDCPTQRDFLQLFVFYSFFPFFFFLQIFQGHDSLSCQKVESWWNRQRQPRKWVKALALYQNLSKNCSGKALNRNYDISSSCNTYCRMLENKAFKDTFCWNDKGTTFIVKDTNEFSRTILPKHFKHCNFASFVRQLNKYDFHKVRNGDDGQKIYGDQVFHG